jgi:hypothetical protein
MTFGELVAEAMRRKRWGDYHVSAAIGLLPGNKVINNTQVRRIRTGERQNLTRDLVERLVQVLDLDEEQAWFLSGLWPPDLSVDGYRRYRHRLAVVGASSDQPDPKSGRFWRSPGQRRGPERRRRDRRHLRLIPAA